MIFSERSNWPHDKNRLMDACDRKKSLGLPIVDLTESNPTHCGFKYMHERFLSPLGNTDNLIYEPEPRGVIKAREAVVDYYQSKGIRLEPSQIFLLSSTSEAYLYLFRLLADNGKMIWVPRPGYPLFDILARLGDVCLRPYPLIYGTHWQMDLSVLSGIQSQTDRALIVVNPHNPTGHLVSVEEREVIVAGCKETCVPLISDEVFLDYTAGAEPQSFAQEKRILTFTLSGVSKVLGLPQMKVSWIIVNGPKDLQQEAIHRLEIIADSFLSVSTPSQHALPVWMKERESIQDEILTRIKHNRSILQAQARRSRAFEILAQDAGWTAICRFFDGRDDEELALELLEKLQILAYPGHFFDLDDASYLVFSLLPEEPVFETALQKIADYLLVSR